MAQTKCPECSTVFDAAGNRTYGGLLREMWPWPARPFWAKESIAGSSRVKCPKCGAAFQSDAVRYLGVFGPRGMYRFVIAFDVGLVLVMVVAVIVSMRGGS